MVIKSRISFPVHATEKPGTAERAEITARVKIPRGRQLVEHNPWELLPDPNNPRPNEAIDEQWMKRVLGLGTEKSLCMLDGKNWIIPEYKELDENVGLVTEPDYDDLRRLALSIRHEGLIQPIEIFLADKNNEPEYFKDNDLYYAYVVVEGHRRRLAAMMAGLDSIMCVEITDDTMLAKLKVKNRKLRRQLSENNLRKKLSVKQHLIITKQLLNNLSQDGDISPNELSTITGLNLKICQVLKKLASSPEGRYPEILFNHIQDNKLTFKQLRMLVPRSYSEIVKSLTSGSLEESDKINVSVKQKSGRQKSSAKFVVKAEKDALSLSQYLFKTIPGLNVLDSDSPYAKLEDVLSQILKKASDVK